jgi:hypothetical protein
MEARLAIPNRFVISTVVALRTTAGCPLPYGESRREDGGTRATLGVRFLAGLSRVHI